MKYYWNPHPKVPVFEYVAISDIATHFFQCPLDWGNGDIEYMRLLYQWEIPPNDYFGRWKLPDQIMKILPKKEQQAIDEIRQEKIEKAYQEMERKRLEKLAQKKGKR